MSEQNPIISLLPELFLTEESAQRQCATVVRRLDFALPSLPLLEVVNHADAALDDLRGLAELRGVRLGNLANAVAAFVASVGRAVSAALFEPYVGYARAVDEMRRGVALGRRLRDAAVSRGDGVLAEWCTLWLGQRSPMVGRIEQQLASAGVTP